MTSINADQIGTFLKITYNTDKLSLSDAKDLGVDIKDFNLADSDQDGELTIEEIEACDDMAKFISGIIEKNEELKNEESEEDKNSDKRVNSKGDANNN